MMFWGTVGILAAILTSFGFLPQIAKMLKTKSVKDISLVTLLQFAIGTLLWFAYGLHIKDWIIIGANFIAFATLVNALYFYSKFSPKKT